MEKIEIRSQILDTLNDMTLHQQERLLEFIRSFVKTKRKAKPNILKLIGTISKEDLKKMEKSIEDDCEKINSDDW